MNDFLWVSPLCPMMSYLHRVWCFSSSLARNEHGGRLHVSLAVQSKQIQTADVTFYPQPRSVTHTHTGCLVSIAAKQTLFQTPASCLATPPHYHGDAIKSNGTDTCTGRKRSGERMDENEVKRDDEELAERTQAEPCFVHTTHTHQLFFIRVAVCAAFVLVLVLCRFCGVLQRSSHPLSLVIFSLVPSIISVFPHFHLFSCFCFNRCKQIWYERQIQNATVFREDEEAEEEKPHTHEKSSTKCVSVHVWSQQGARLVASWCPQICSRPHCVWLNLHHNIQHPVQSDSEILNSGMNKPERGMGTFFKNLHNMTEKCVNDLT